jgi:hypothetical protein
VCSNPSESPRFALLTLPHHESSQRLDLRWRQLVMLTGLVTLETLDQLRTYLGVKRPDIPTLCGPNEPGNQEVTLVR